MKNTAAHYRATRLTAAEFDRLATVYLAREVAVSRICTRFKISAKRLAALAEANGWPLRVRGKALKGQQRKIVKPPKAVTLTQRIAERKAADEKRTREMYGDTIADVNFLRQRGFVVTREGSGYRVGNTLCDSTELRAKADRERRLSAAQAAPGIAWGISGPGRGDSSSKPRNKEAA